jgi:hypothetical protein
MTATDASPRRAQSLQGHTSEEAEDFPRHYPPTNLLIGEGFAVMSGVCTRSHLRVGQLCLPDKEFRYLRHSCYSAFGWLPMRGQVISA